MNRRLRTATGIQAVALEFVIERVHVFDTKHYYTAERAISCVLRQLDLRSIANEIDDPIRILRLRILLSKPKIPS